ncbi:MAG: DEAD/DEAH box helicase family protein [Nitrospira sp.]|nr:DEAD/DEAH box helicase family protein [Nitrospira sp.]
MTDAVIHYDKDLPEIPGRVPWERPTQHLVKDGAAASGWSVADGRRSSRLLLITNIRSAVDTWRKQSYPGVAEPTRRLLEYWFEEDHAVQGFNVPFRYYFCQREAIETLVWLVEICNNRDAKALIEEYGEDRQVNLVSRTISFQTLQDGTRQLLRYVDEVGREIARDLPPQDLRRYAFKMATGSGKTWVMAMAIVWAFFHKKMVPDSDLSTNFLVVAPNVIVYQRLEKDFADNRIFRNIPLVPPEWRGRFSLKVILRGTSTEPDPGGNLFLSNIHQLYGSREQEWSPSNAVDALLGRKPASDADQSGGRTMLKRVQSLKNVMVLNDEAHHVHDDTLEWSKSLLSVHRALPGGLSLWLDFSATPKDDAGYFPWTVCDYPLAQAVEDHIVKAPLIVTKEDDPKQPDQDPDGVTKDNVTEKYAYWLQAAVHRWKDHQSVYNKLGTKPVLFIMAEKSNQADAIGAYLWKTPSFGLKQSEVLVIHTNSDGDITQKDLEEARKAARDIDQNEIKVIVSVLMLREGWDVRNVSVVLGLRPFTAKAEILPEQVIGRGLRLMTSIGPERTQTLEVLGTRNLLKVLREQLEADGVGVKSTANAPPLPVTVAPVVERAAYDIHIPLTRPHYFFAVQNLDKFDVTKLEPIYDREELEEAFRIDLKIAFQVTDTSVHQAAISVSGPVEEKLASITNMVMARVQLTGRFADLYPKIKTYVEGYCFGGTVDLNSENVRSNLSKVSIREGIVEYLAREIRKVTLETRELEFERADFRLFQTSPFAWRRNLPPLRANKTVFNYVATYNDFERRFAEFLDRASDVLRFASLGTTEQGESGTRFRVDYLKPSGAIGFYHPDWAVVQRTSDGEVHWIIETKGRVWAGTKEKDDAINRWCQQITEQTGKVWRYRRIQQTLFDSMTFGTLGGLVGRA